MDAPAVRGARLLTMTYAVATVLATTGFLLGHSGPGRAGPVQLAFGLLNVPMSDTLVSAVVLAVVTRALLGRKRVGLVLVAAFQVLGILLGVAAAARLLTAPAERYWPAHELVSTGLDTASIGVGLVALVLLRRLRPAFPGHTPPGSWFRLAATVLVGAAVTGASTWAALELVPSTREEATRLLLPVLARGLGDPDAHARWVVRPPAWVPGLTSLLAAATVVLAVVLFLQSAQRSTGWSPDRELGLRRLLATTPAPDSLGYFATRRDKASVSSPDGRAAVTYRVEHGVSLASGDPVGELAAWPAAIGAWQAEARYYGWLPAVLSASEAGARAYAAAGLRPLVMGDEAVLDPRRFRLTSPARAHVRHAARRAARAGLQTSIGRQADLTAAELAELADAAERWRRGTDRGFSMALNRVADPADRQVLWVRARDADGRLAGLLAFVPWGREGVSLDLMRRHPDAPNGVTELMVTDLLGAAPGLGITRVSLNFCLLRGVYAAGSRFGAGALTRFHYSFLGVLDRFWQLERLYRANEKYSPDWRPRFLCYEDLVALPQVLFATASAEGFLPRLRLPARRPPAGGGLTADQLAELARLEAAPPPPVTGPPRSAATRHRLGHLEALTATGRSAYPVGGPAPTSTTAELAARWHSDGSDGSDGPVRVAARVRRVRDHGRLAFADVTDAGQEVQVLLEAARCGGEPLRAFTRLVDTGDLVLFEGLGGRSRNGTPSLLVTRWQLLAKALHPVPFDRVDDPAARLRQRSTDLLVHPGRTAPLRARAAVLTALRQTLVAQGFLEVETPVLQAVHGGANARPFTTVSNAYGVDLSLRIAPELYLKRLLVAGLGPVFEIGRSFRNEGADATHNPEFTSLEAYLPYADYTRMRELTEQLVQAAATAVHGRPLLRLHRGGRPQLVDVGGRWPVVPVLDAVSAAVGRRVGLDTDPEELLRLAERHRVPVRPGAGPGALLEELYGHLVERRTTTPTFYCDFPVETSPLTALHRQQPGLVERWDLVADGMEVATAYSELTDPREQRRRLTAQSWAAAHGDEEAMEVDEDFLHALETGMPPSGGLGLGVDRLLMLLTADTIREVLTFPFVRPAR